MGGNDWLVKWCIGEDGFRCGVQMSSGRAYSTRLVLVLSSYVVGKQCLMYSYI